MASSTDSCAICADGRGVVRCCSGFDAVSEFCEGLTAGRPSPIRFCREAISFRLASNLLSRSAFSLCSFKSSV